MQDIVVTLVFMMAILMFSAFPAYKISLYFQKKYAFSPRVQNYLTLFLTILLALVAAIFLKVG